MKDFEVIKEQFRLVEAVEDIRRFRKEITMTSEYSAIGALRLCVMASPFDPMTQRQKWEQTPLGETKAAREILLKHVNAAFDEYEQACLSRLEELASRPES